ncbi:tRNA dimethylallyltransferase-like isoform X1 [Crassostrea virginica]
MAASMKAPLRVPVIFILGATGTGKSKLALEIGIRFNGEIISTDSMQIYKGLDIVTNKVTREEQEACPHHMINYLSPLEENHHIHHFRNRAIPIIEKILNDKKIPIIVGGTNYYIESLLWNTLIKPEDVKRAQKTTSVSQRIEEGRNADVDKEMVEKLDEEDMDKTDSTKEMSSFHRDLNNKALYERLQRVDPKTASATHPNDRRKMLRALNVFDEHGIPVSEIHEAQRSAVSQGLGELRFPNSCVLWVQSDQNVLDVRTNKRVDTMIEQGLIQELLDFHQAYNVRRKQENREIDYTTGIFQSIGFKEFHSYLILSEDEKNSEKGKLLFDEGVEKMKIATRQYARRQIYWIKNRLLRNRGHQYPPVYAVDSTDPSQWSEKVHDPAIQIVQDYLDGTVPKQEPLPLTEYTDGVEFNECKICNKTFVMKNIWKLHLNSKVHKKRMKSFRKTCDILDKRIEMKTAEREITLGNCSGLESTNKRLCKGLDNSDRDVSIDSTSEGSCLDVKAWASDIDSLDNGAREVTKSCEVEAKDGGTFDDV